MIEYYVYIMTNYRNTVLYTGVTNDLRRRADEHKMGLSLDSFTKRYHIYKVVYFATFPTTEEAIAYEKTIKGWRRIKKASLIEKENPEWEDLLTE